MMPKLLHTTFLLTLLAAAAGAQPAQPPVGGFSIGVRPQLIDLTGPAGVRRTFDLYVRNFDKLRTAHVWLWAADALQTSTGALEFDESGTYPYGAARWFKVSKSELTIGPDREERVTVQLAVPGNTRGSGHGIIVVSGSPPKNVPIPPTAENQAYVVTRVAFGVIIHYAIPGTAVTGAVVESMHMTTDMPPGSGLTKETSPSKYWLVARVRNTGNVLIRGYGWALLRRLNQGLVERWRLGVKDYGTQKIIYPGRSVDMYMPVTRPLPSGEYVAQMRLDYAPNRAATADVPITVTNNAEQGTFGAQTGPFATQTIGLALTLEKELETVSTAPGGFRTGRIKVTNNEGVPLLVEMSVQDVSMDADGVLIPNEASTPQTATASWLNVAPHRFSLPPGKSRQLAYTTALGADLPNANDLVGLIRLRARQLDPIARQTQGEIIGDTGLLLVLTQAGRGQRKGDIGVMQVDVRPELPGIIRVGVPVRNVGNVHFLPVVNLQLTGRDNPAFQVEKVLGKGSGQVLILPGRERMVWFELPANQFTPGQYVATVTLDYGGAQPERKVFNVQLHDPGGAPTKAAPPAKDTQKPAPAQGEQKLKPVSGHTERPA